MDMEKLHAYMLKTKRDQQFIDEAVSAATSGDAVWQEFVNREALFSHIATLSNVGLMDRKDVEDLLNLDPTYNGETAAKLGVTDYARDNKELALKYYDMIKGVRANVRTSNDLKTAEDMAYANVKSRIQSHVQ
jgi:hypothetical protein